jgi:hypothetical protein
MDYIKTFGFFKLKNNWFVFRQISFLQKLMFLFIYGCLIILSWAFAICVPIIAILEHESLKTVLKTYDGIFSDIMCTAVFAFFINFNYKLAWWNPLLECCCGVGKYPEYKQQYWMNRQKIIDKLKDIENM